MDISNLQNRFYCSSTSETGLRYKDDYPMGKSGNLGILHKDSVAGSMSSSSGYYSVKVGTVSMLCHRVIWAIAKGRIPKGLFIDHKDGDKTNNKIENLRVVNRDSNSQNCKTRKDNSSGVVGVTLLKNKLSNGKEMHYWRAFWSEGGKVKNKSFSCRTFGHTTAKSLAIEYRNEVIRRLNKEGADYTARHTTPNKGV